MAAWQDWAPDGPDDITANLAIIADPGRPVRAVVFGACLRDAEATAAVLDELAAGAGSRPGQDLRGGMAFRDLKRSFSGPGAGDEGAQATAGRSEFFSRALPPDAIGALLDELASGRRCGRRELNFTAMGGAYNRVAADATAFAHRGERFLLEHAAGDDPRWVDRSWAIAHAHGSGRVYPNFPDPQLDRWGSAYHGGNLDRLVAVKRTYDPGRLFRFPQGL